MERKEGEGEELDWHSPSLRFQMHILLQEKKLLLLLLQEEE